MSTTTVGDLLDQAQRHAARLRATGTGTGTGTEITTDQWRSFDSAIYRLLHELVGPERVTNRKEIVAHATVSRILNNYPTPLAAPNPEATYNARQAATHLGISPGTVAQQIRKSQLPATYDSNGRHRIKATDLAPAEVVHPADPTSTHPVDRLSCTLGALADMVVAERARPNTIPGFDPLRDDAQVAPVIARLCVITVVTARHTLANIPLQDVDRPLLIARYAEHSLDTLGDVNRPSELNRVASFAPPSSPRGPNEELEVALRGWASHARSELARTIPSTEVLRDIANQARHLYAVSTRLMAASFASGDVAKPAAELVHTELRAAAQIMHGLQQQWERVTTATRPHHEYVTATTALHASLSVIERESLLPGAHVKPDNQIDVAQALADLRYAATDLAELTHTAAQLPEPLIRSQLLFAPARILPSTMERVHDRSHGRYVPILLKEGTALIDAAQAASNAARSARESLEIASQPAAATELSSQLLTGEFARGGIAPATGPGLF